MNWLWTANFLSTPKISNSRKLPKRNGRELFYKFIYLLCTYATVTPLPTNLNHHVVWFQVSRNEFHRLTSELYQRSPKLMGNVSSSSSSSDDDVARLIIVRHPFERLLSSYHNKLTPDSKGVIQYANLSHTIREMCGTPLRKKGMVYNVCAVWWRHKQLEWRHWIKLRCRI